MKGCWEMRSVIRRVLCAVAPAAVLLGVLAQVQPALGAGPQAGAAASVVATSGPVTQAGSGQPGSQSPGLASPGKMLPSGWARSGDVVATVQGDAAGLHVLVADEGSAYSWRTAATLGDPGVETTQWIGQGCVTASGRYMIVVYAPREVTNIAGEMGVLGRAAVVNLQTGAVRQLGGGFSVAYFNPGCGAGEDAVLTRGGWGGDTPGLPASTGLEMLDAATGVTLSAVTVPGQATSGVPDGNSIVAAYRQGIARFGANGRYNILTSTSAVPFRLIPDRSGGLGYEVLHGSQVGLYRLAGGRTSAIGSAPERSVQLVGSGGKVWLTGARATQTRGLPTVWQPLDVPAGSVVSTTGELAVTDVSVGPRTGSARTDPVAALPTEISAQVLSGKRPHVSFTVPAAVARPAPLAGDSGQNSSGTAAGRRAVMGPVAAASTNPATTTTSPDRTCAISVDDPSVQAYQPDFQQVEWAADQAVHGHLTDTRPAGLYGSSLPSYTPQGMFALPSLSGGGTIPAQVLLGVLTQESNLEQASVHVDQGQASNPLTSFNWFGNWVNNGGTWTETNHINWDTSDCGYGIGQVTTGMCLAVYQNGDPECQYATPMSATDQLAVAVDYQANIAKAAQVLAGYWNQLAADGITMTSTSGASANYIENWYMALWAYNSGLEPGTSIYGNTTGCTPGPSCADGNGDWGLGYADNPANPAYPPDRPVFPSGSANNYTAPGGGSYSPSWDLSHPQYWTYQEKVISWAFDAVTLYDYNQGKSVQAFAYASGNAAYPPVGEFCTSADHCNPGVLNTTQPASNGDACGLTGSYADHCWWHWPATVTCSVSCGTEALTYAPGAAAPGDPAIAAGFAEDCTLGGLPSGAVIVGEDSAAMGCPGENWTEAAPMTWQFGSETNIANGSGTTYPSKIYFDQIGSGFGGHFWFGYTTPNNHASGDAPGNPPNVTPANPALEITGTWPAPSSVSGWTNVLVHMPSYGSWDPQAVYQINPGGGAATQYRVINQAQQQNTWVSLGTFALSSGASVSLSNVTFSGLGRDIAWNGLAYVHSSAPNYDYVALGDSYSSGQGLSPYQPDSSYSYNGMTSSCDRSQTQAYPDLVHVPGVSTPVAQKAASPGSGYEFDFLACNGMYSTQISEAGADSPETSYGKVSQNSMPGVPAWDSYSLGSDELPQADTGYLNGNTNLVTMTTGGDDIRFAGVVSACFTGQTLTGPCTATLPGDPQPLNNYEPTVISALAPHLEQVYKAVADEAANAKIIVIAYPNLFTGDTSSLGCAAFPPASPGLADWFDQMGDDLRAQTETAVAWAVTQGIKITMINAEPEFNSHHSCDSANWINYVDNGGGGSFHPNAAGQQEFANLVNECLAGALPAADLVPGDGTCP